MANNTYKTILGIETSCDETSCSIVTKEANRATLFSNIVSSSLLLHSKYGGIIPEQAAREQIKAMIPVVTEALLEAERTPSEIDAIAVTTGPGLIGSLLVGVETAKILGEIWQKPIIPVNHLIAHFYANWISTGEPNFTVPQFPALGLLVSGGHTDLIIMENHGKYTYIGGTRDDAAGECFDKCARVLGFAYPGGPKISKLAEEGDVKGYSLPVPMANSHDNDFSFSGLKTAFVRLIEDNFNITPGYFDKEKDEWIQIPLEEQLSTNQLRSIKDICASLEGTIVKAVVLKTVAAAKKYNIEHVVISGGVAANKRLREEMHKILALELPLVSLHIPPPSLCTDNGATIAAYALFNPHSISTDNIQANPNLSL